MHIDIERMKKALEGEPIEIPQGLRQESFNKYIMSAGKCQLKNSDFNLHYSALYALVYEYHCKSSEARHLRLGQWFCNNYLKQPWPELYYQEDEKKAEEMIEKWLDDHQYVRNVPDKVA